MRLGVVFPTMEIGSDPIAIRDYVQTVEGLGYDYLLTYDRVLGVNPAGLAAGMAPTPTTTPSTSRSCCSATWRP